MMQFNLVFEQLSTDATDGCMTKRFKLSVNDRKKTLLICHRFFGFGVQFFSISSRNITSIKEVLEQSQSKQTYESALSISLQYNSSS